MGAFWSVPKRCDAMRCDVMRCSQAALGTEALLPTLEKYDAATGVAKRSCTTIRVE